MWLRALLFSALLLSIPAGAKRLTQGFHVAKMALDFPSHLEWEMAAETNIRPILEQKYLYLGRGAQCYVFESEDEKYVIKLFRFDRLSSVTKITTLFSACKMAYDSLREETGLLFVHLNPTSKSLPILHCKDAIGRSYKLNLDTYRFVVQKKAIPFRKALELARKDPQKLQNRIDQFLDLIRSRIAKEIRNTDPNVGRNFGFLEDRAVEFDCGNYCYCPGMDGTKEMERYVCKLRRWLKKNAPESVAYLDDRLK